MKRKKMKLKFEKGKQQNTQVKKNGPGGSGKGNSSIYRQVDELELRCKAWWLSRTDPDN